MIISKNGMVLIEGKHEDAVKEIIAILAAVNEAVNEAVKENEIDNNDLYAIVSIAPEVITEFCNNLSNSTHK